MNDFLHGTWQTLVDYWLLLSTISAAFAMGVLRTAKANGKIDWLEAGMCGVFAYGIWFLLGFFNFPEGAGVLLGGIVGYKGTHFVSDWISMKLGLNSNEDKQ